MRAALRPATCWLGAAILLSALLSALQAGATTVYKTVDEHGVVSYSDTKPDTDTAVETMTIDVADPEVSAQARQRLEDMRETTDRMAADRMAREKHRAEMRQLNDQQYREPADYPEFYDSSTIYTGYSRRRSRWDNHHRPRPEHPIARPPLRPRPDHHYREGVSRPVYNEYPASLVRKGYDPRVREVIETGHYPARRRR